MALLNQPTQVHAQLEKLFETMRAGQAPDKFNREFLKDLGFKSSNHHAFIPLLKGLGFLTADGAPTDRYKEFLDKTKWKKVLAQAVREAYGDIFVLKAEPTANDKDLITGKFKSTYNLSDLVAERASRTFLALLELSDKPTLFGTAVDKKPEPEKEVTKTEDTAKGKKSNDNHLSTGLHYNLQIHLPATKDVEVYNAIFRSLREHLVD